MIALYALAFSALYAIKGGQHKHIPLLNRVDGKILSTLGAALFSPVLAIGWLIGIAPSMGEEVGAVGGYRGGWGPYLEKGFGRGYGVKKCLQRGVFMGAALALATGAEGLILVGATLPVAAFVGNSIQQIIDNEVRVDWHLHEFIYGAALGAGVCLGLA